MRRLLLLLAAGLSLAGAASAHDTWFERLPGAGVQLALGTGNQFPRFDTGIDAQYLADQGCRQPRGVVALRPAGDLPAALQLNAPPDAQVCWAQLAPFELELAPDKIALYLREIGAGPELRATWARLQARGLPWRERYTKHARIALAAGGGGEPVPMAMDVLMETGSAPMAPAFQLLRDGRPLPNQPVELRHENSPLGVWRRTDAQGRITVPPLPAGRWVLRATDLRLSDTRPDTWESRFVTLAFELPLQNGSSLTSNARSTSQAPASTAMASEPPSSTTRR